MKPIILFRIDRDLQGNEAMQAEKAAAEKYFTVVDNRMVFQDNLVIGRYSVLPYYEELDRDCKYNGSVLANSFKQHCYIANFEYYHDVEKYTPKTWFKLTDIRNEQGPFMLKGVTNSRKHEWDKFYAEDFAAAVEVYGELQRDPLIGKQDIIIRKFEKLKNFGFQLNGMPWSNEWRFFFYKNKMLCYAYYWTGGEFIPEKSELDPKAIELAKEISDIIKDHTNFYVIDVAQKENGDWMLIEINEAMMSGLSGNDPDELYKNLAKAIAEDTDI